MYVGGRSGNREIVGLDMVYTRVDFTLSKPEPLEFEVLLL